MARASAGVDHQEGMTQQIAKWLEPDESTSSSTLGPSPDGELGTPSLPPTFACLCSEPTTSGQHRVDTACSAALQRSAQYKNTLHPLPCSGSPSACVATRLSLLWRLPVFF